MERPRHSHAPGSYYASQSHHVLSAQRRASISSLFSPRLFATSLFSAPCFSSHPLVLFPLSATHLRSFPPPCSIPPLHPALLIVCAADIPSSHVRRPHTWLPISMAAKKKQTARKSTGADARRVALVVPDSDRILRSSFRSTSESPSIGATPPPPPVPAPPPIDAVDVVMRERYTDLDHVS